MAVREWNAGFHDLSRIFAPLASLQHGLESCAQWPELADFNALARDRTLTNAAGMPLSFVESAPKRRRRRKSEAPPALSYEEQIFHHAKVPTRRHSWHDFFNMLVWVLLPQTKAALNERQVSEARGSKTRTREQDRLAMFDEGGAIAVVPHGILPAGLASNVLTATPPWLVVAGHAVYESVVTEERGIRLLTLVLTKSPAFFAQSFAAQRHEVDAEAAAAIRSGSFALDGGAPLTGVLLKDLL